MTDKKIPTLKKPEVVSTMITEQPYAVMSEYPFCALPPHYFDAAEARRKSEIAKTKVPTVQARSILTIETWDGRKIVSHESP